MPTRLGQKRVKSSDPAYQTLEEQLHAKSAVEGSDGYQLPLGGMPRTDMTEDVQDDLQKGKTAYQKPDAGIPVTDLDKSTQESIEHAAKSYIKAESGIPYDDLAEEIQEKLDELSMFYVYPDTGIPSKDLSADVVKLLERAAASYPIPEGGIPLSILAQDVIDAINKSKEKYSKPEGGIPLSDLAVEVAEQEDLDKTDKMLTEHVENDSIHITDHTKLESIGQLTHDEIDKSIENAQYNLKMINREIGEARDEFASIGARIDATLGKNSLFTIDTYDEWKQGTYEDLLITTEGNVSFDYASDLITAKVYEWDGIGEKGNFLSSLYLGEEFHYDSEAWPVADAQKAIVEYGGYIYAPTTGDYFFTLNMVGSAKVQIGGKIIHDQINYGESASRDFTINLEGGRLYPIVIINKHNGHIIKKHFSLRWKPPGQTNMVYVPQSNLTSVGYVVNEGTYESQIIDLLDNQISQWYLETDMVDYRTDDDVLAFVSTSEDGESFSEWQQTLPIGEINATPYRFIRVKFIMRKEFAQYTPLLRKIQIRYISQGANNAYFHEIEEARNKYLKLADRLSGIDKAIQDVTNFYQTLDKSYIHPEYYMSARLASIEINLLEDYIRRAAGNGAFPITDGFVDHFDDTNFIDIHNSGEFVNSNHTISNKEVVKNVEPSDWDELDGTLTYSSRLQLAYRSGASAPSSEVLDNSYSSASSSNAIIGERYQRMIAQPFYTGANIAVITKLNLYRSAVSYTTYENVLIVPTKTNGQPDINNPIYTHYIGNGSSISNVRIEVNPETKYWIVIQYSSYSGSNYAYTYWGVNNSSNTNASLRGSNPGNENLYFRYTDNGSSWYQQTSYFLSFRLEFSNGYMDSGEARAIMDFIKPVNFIKASVTGLLQDGITLKYQSSDNQIIWSQETTELSDVPSARFLRAKAYLAMTSGGTPTIANLAIYHTGKTVEVWSKPIDMEYLPNYAMMIAQDDDIQDSIRYQISRDNGVTWEDAMPYRYTDLRSIRPGKKLRLKAIFDGDNPATTIDYWGILGISHRDISGQNITALYEEYDGFVGGEMEIKLKDRYQLGTNALQVYLNGIRQSIERDYLEIDEYTIRFTEGLDPEDRLTLVVQSGVYGVHDATLVSRIEELEHSTDEVDKNVIYEYDENDNLVKEYHKTPRYKELEYQYDEFGRKEKQILRIADKVLVTSFTYDYKNRIIEEKTTSEEVTI